jgi:hypothetical protein
LTESVRCFQIVADDYSALHDEHDVLYRADVGQRVVADGANIGILAARGEAAELAGRKKKSCGSSKALAHLRSGQV